MDINQIVDFILDKNFYTDYLWSVYGFERIRNENIPLEDTMKELKGIVTDFVVYEFLNTSQQLCQFISLVYTTFDEAINLYINRKGLIANDILFIYKGGNVLRFIYNKAFYMLPGKVKNDLIAYYKDSFKKSDADFSIYINPGLKDFDDIFNDITTMAFLLLNYLRNIFLGSKNYFNYYNLSKESKIDSLEKYLIKLNNSDSIQSQTIPGKYVSLSLPNINSAEKYTDIPIKKYIPKFDYEIIFEKMAGILIDKNKKTDNESTTIQLKIKPIHLTEFEVDGLDKLTKLERFANDQLQIYGDTSQSEFIIGINRTTTFVKYTQIASFNLVRTKVSFNAERNIDERNITDKIDGELIDVSIPNRNDSAIKHFYDHFHKYVTEYVLEEDPCKIPFKAYSIEYLIYDLENILYTGAEFPWDDSKYAKRMNRLLFMYYLSFFTNESFNNNQRINYLAILRDLVLESSKNYSTNKRQEIIKNIDLFFNTCLKYSNASDSKCLADKVPIIRLVIKIRDLVMNKNLNPEKFRKFIDLIIKNLNIQQKSLKELNEFINKSGEFDKADLYTGHIGGRDQLNTNKILF